MLLIHVGELHGLTHLEGSLIGLVEAHDETEEGGLTRTVGADNTYNAVGRKHEIEVLIEQLVAECLGHALCLDHLVTQAGTVGDKDLEFLFALFLVLVQEFVI